MYAAKWLGYITLIISIVFFLWVFILMCVDIHFGDKPLPRGPQGEKGVNATQVGPVGPTGPPGKNGTLGPLGPGGSPGEMYAVPFSKDLTSSTGPSSSNYSGPWILGNDSSSVTDFEGYEWNETPLPGSYYIYQDILSNVTGTNSSGTPWTVKISGIELASTYTPPFGGSSFAIACSSSSSSSSGNIPFTSESNGDTNYKLLTSTYDTMGNETNIYLPMNTTTFFANPNYLYSDSNGLSYYMLVPFNLGWVEQYAS